MGGANGNDFASTGYSGWTFTNPLTGGGAKAFKMLYTQRGSDGVSHVTTIPVVCTDFDVANSDNVEDFSATLLVVGTPSTV